MGPRRSDAAVSERIAEGNVGDAGDATQFRLLPESFRRIMSFAHALLKLHSCCRRTRNAAKTLPPIIDRHSTPPPPTAEPASPPPPSSPRSTRRGTPKARRIRGAFQFPPVRLHLSRSNYSLWYTRTILGRYTEGSCHVVLPEPVPRYMSVIPYRTRPWTTSDTVVCVLETATDERRRQQGSRPSSYQSLRLQLGSFLLAVFLIFVCFLYTDCTTEMFSTSYPLPPPLSPRSPSRYTRSSWTSDPTATAQ